LALLTAGAFAAALGAEEPGFHALFLIFSFPVTVPVLVLAASVARTRSRLRRADGSIVASAARPSSSRCWQPRARRSSSRVPPRTARWTR